MRSASLLSHARPKCPAELQNSAGHASEDDIQSEAIQHLQTVIKPPAMFWHVPNGARLRPSQARKMKRLGMRAGVADIHIVWPGGYGFIEMKSAKGRTSPEQREFLQNAEACGARVAVCRSVDDVVATLASWGVLTGP